MAENENLLSGAAPDEQPQDTVIVPPAAPVAEAPAAPVGPRLRETVWNFRSMVAVAAASLLIGGAGGAAIVGLASGDDGPDRMRIVNIGGEGPGFRQGPFDGPNGQFRQFPQDGSQSGPPGSAPSPAPQPGTNG